MNDILKVFILSLTFIKKNFWNFNLEARKKNFKRLSINLIIKIISFLKHKSLKFHVFKSSYY